MTEDLTRRDVVAGIGSVAAAGSLAGCGGDSGTTGDGNGGDDTEEGGNGDGGDGTTTVEMTSSLAFEPAEVTVSTGDTVVWDNVGDISHSVTAYEEDIPEDAEYWASGGFDSEQAAREAYVPDDTEAGAVPGGETWEHTFETAGTHEYFCIPHPGMEGTVVVKES